MRQIFIKTGLFLLTSLIGIDGLFAQWTLTGSVNLSPEHKNKSIDCEFNRQGAEAQMKAFVGKQFSTRDDCLKLCEELKKWNKYSSSCGFTVKCDCNGPPSTGRGNQSNNGNSAIRYNPSYGSNYSNLPGVTTTTFAPPPQSQSRGFEDTPEKTVETNKPANIIYPSFADNKLDDLFLKLEKEMEQGKKPITGLDPNATNKNTWVNDYYSSPDFTDNPTHALREASKYKENSFSNIDDGIDDNMTARIDFGKYLKASLNIALAFSPETSLFGGTLTGVLAVVVKAAVPVLAVDVWTQNYLAYQSSGVELSDLKSLPDIRFKDMKNTSILENTFTMKAAQEIGVNIAGTYIGKGVIKSSDLPVGIDPKDLEKGVAIILGINQVFPNN